MWDRFRDRAFWLSQQAVRNVREQADVVLYLVNAAEAPQDAGYLDPEMRVLEWIGKPVIVLLNQTGRPRPREEERADEARWRSALAGSAHGDGGAHARRLRALLGAGDRAARPGRRRVAGGATPRFARLAQAWQARRFAQFDAAMAALAAPIADAACDREVLPDPGMKGALRELGRSLGLGRDDGEDAKREASGALAARLDAGTRGRAPTALIALHQLEGRARGEVLERLAAGRALERRSTRARPR